MNKKISLGAAIAAIIICITITVCITMVISTRVFSDKVYNLKERENMYDKIAEIDRIVRQNYNGNIDQDKIMDSVSKGYVSGLDDPYSKYFTASELALLTTTQEGRTIGIGIDYVMDKSGYIKVVEVYPNSSAQETGIKVGDFITKIDGEAVTLANYKEKTALLQGDAGTKITITVRSGDDDRDIELTRRVIKIPTVRHKIIDSIGYIKISKFNNLTAEQFRDAIKICENAKVKGYIFDVRNNPGGTVSSVTEILDMLLPKGEIVSATYKNGETKVLATSDSKQIDLPMVVLVNEQSASASELFTQALKDYGKASIVGTKTFGKGLMQVLYPLSDGSALDLTVAKYNPPHSPNFDKVGIKPDFEVMLTPEETKNFAQLDETNDPQLIKAFEVLTNSGASTQNTESLPDDNTTEDEEIDKTSDENSSDVDASGKDEDSSDNK